MAERAAATTPTLSRRRPIRGPPNQHRHAPQKMPCGSSILAETAGAMSATAAAATRTRLKRMVVAVYRCGAAGRHWLRYGGRAFRSRATRWLSAKPRSPDEQCTALARNITVDVGPSENSPTVRSRSLIQPVSTSVPAPYFAKAPPGAHSPPLAAGRGSTLGVSEWVGPKRMLVRSRWEAALRVFTRMDESGGRTSRADSALADRRGGGGGGELARRRADTARTRAHFG